MEILDFADQDVGLVLSAYCKCHCKFGIYFSFSDEWLNADGSPSEELLKACPTLNDVDKYHTSWAFKKPDGRPQGFMIFDDRPEMKFVYDTTSGDSPNHNDYDGPCSVYMVTCNSDGVLENENT